jgi:hypothetical protein
MWTATAETMDGEEKVGEVICVMCGSFLVSSY